LNYPKDGNQRTKPGNATKPKIAKESAIKRAFSLVMRSTHNDYVKVIVVLNPSSPYIT
jgi:hypothetical protein